MSTSKRSQPPQPIRKPQATTAPPITVDSVYGKDQWKQATGLGETAWQQARRNGLAVLSCHGRSFVTGRAWLEYIEAQRRSV